jgi:hypothetical protein
MDCFTLKFRFKYDTKEILDDLYISVSRAVHSQINLDWRFWSDRDHTTEKANRRNVIEAVLEYKHECFKPTKS